MLLVLSMGASEVVPRASMSDIAPKLVHALREYNPVFVPCVFLIMQQGPVFWKVSIYSAQTYLRTDNLFFSYA